MDDLGGRPNDGVVMEDRLLTSTLGPPPNPDPSSISEDCWVIAEEKTIEIINFIHPTLDSEEKRKDVIDYVQRLIRNSLGCEVFPYGSVPLKTYLPDGDIDLTALSNLNIEESLAHDALAILRREEQCKSEYEVKDTQFIDAEVKLVKCLVQNIVVDISFNQLGGLCTLCFLEQVDRLVGKNHLFKRSIILIKAWCYYESRILGAHHGLISTYALETLVLYIFHLFHKSLSGPLAVLYRFLDYFSKFDWENYCISLNGPVRKSSLPDVVVEIPENGRHDLMLSEEFLRNCMDMFSVPSRGLETNLRAFPQKYLNIIDPLKENNNLGRSVHRGNFYRIRSAFKYGARKLGRTLLLSKEELADEIKQFFTNTLDRHGRKYGVDIQNSLFTFGAEGTGTLSLSSHDETLSENEMHLKSLSADFDEDILGVEHRCSVFRNELNTYSRVDYSQIVSESGCSTDRTTVSGYRLAGDANDLASPRSLSFRGANDTSDCSSSSNFSTTLSGQYYYAPHFYLPGSSTTENGYFENGNLWHRRPPDWVDEKMDYDSWLEHGENQLMAGNTFSSRVSNNESLSCSGSAISSLDANSLESLCLDCRSLDFRERALAEIVDDAENLNPLSDLSGDYDSHLRSLLYGQSCHGFTLPAPTLPNPPTSFSQFGNKKPWETVRRSMPLKQNLCAQMNTNGGVMGPTVHPDNKCTPFNAAFGLEEKHRTRGTGTYIPKTNRSSCRERLSQGWGRNWAPGNQVQFHRQARNNGVTTDMRRTYSSGEGTCEQLKQATSPVQSHGKSGLFCQSHQSNGSSTHSNGFSNSSWRLVFGSFGQPQEGPALDTSHAWGSTQSSKLVSGEKQERVAEQSYYLKNEDFPPLDGQQHVSRLKN